MPFGPPHRSGNASSPHSVDKVNKVISIVFLLYFRYNISLLILW